MTGQGTGTGLRTNFALAPDGLLDGFVVDPENPDRRFVVEIVADGLPVALLRCSTFRPDVAVGDGCYGFSIRLAPTTLARAESVSARLANAETAFGRVAGPFSDLIAAEPAGTGAVRWAGGLTLTGWCAGDPMQPAAIVKALVDEGEVARAACHGWGEVEEGGIPRLVRTFTLHLPRALADGRVRDVAVVTEDGVDLDGSPQAVFALPDGFAEAVNRLGEIESERVRARFADGLLPQSVPFSAFQGWRERFPPPDPTPGGREVVSVLIVGEDGLEATLTSLERQRGAEWRAAVLESNGSPMSFSPSALRTFRAEGCVGCDLVVATVAGTRFAPDALARLAAGARHFPGAAAVYGDLGPAAPGDDPAGFPAFDEELFLEQGYCATCFALRPATLDAAFPGCDSLFDLFPFSVADGGPKDAATPVHLPVVIADAPRLSVAALGPALAEATQRRLARAGVEASVSNRHDTSVATCRVRRITTARSLSVLIATRDDGSSLASTLQALRATAGGVELDVVVADGGSCEPESLRALAEAEGQGARLLALGGWSSTARRLNEAARAAHCEHLLFLRPGIAAADADWLQEMMSRLSATRCGAVGALVASARGRVRYAGYVVGPRFSATPRFRDCHVSEAGYGGRLEAAQEVSAVSAACMLTRKRDFEEIGGFDGRRFPTAFFDVDYCLRLRSFKRSVIFTPHARLIEADRPGRVVEDASSVPTRDRQAAALAARWALVPGCDPFYSPWMAMDGQPFSGLAWPPAPAEPRQAPRPAPRGLSRDHGSQAR